jgi:hypothetical protein
MLKVQRVKHIAREFGYFSVIVAGIGVFGAAMYELYNLAQNKPTLTTQLPPQQPKQPQYRWINLFNRN